MTGHRGGGGGPMSPTREALLTLAMCARYAAVVLGVLASLVMLADGLTR